MKDGRSENGVLGDLGSLVQGCDQPRDVTDGRSPVVCLVEVELDGDGVERDRLKDRSADRTERRLRLKMSGRVSLIYLKYRTRMPGELRCERWKR